PDPGRPRLRRDRQPLQLRLPRDLHPLRDQGARCRPGDSRHRARRGGDWRDPRRARCSTPRACDRNRPIGRARFAAVPRAAHPRADRIRLRAEARRDARHRRVLLRRRRDDLRRLGGEHAVPAHAGSNPRQDGRDVPFRELRDPPDRRAPRWCARDGDRSADDALDRRPRRAAGRRLARVLANPAPARGAGGGRIVETRVLRNRAIRALLAAEVISTTGGQMTWVALPWFVLVTTGSATRMSLVLAAEAVGLAAFGFPSGRVLNRLGARRTMLLCDGLRGPLMLVVPVLHWMDALSFGLLIAVALALGAFSAPYYSASRLILPELLGEDETVISQASALFQGATRITLLLGPVTAGVLIG